MKWRKLGKIFDPTQHKLFNGCEAFAQSPQTLVFDDFVRIYFSTRKRDESNGKFASHIAYVEMDLAFKNILKINDHTVIELGAPGTFDEHGIFPINPVRHNGQVWAYTCGWSRRVSVSVETSTGLAISDDEGKTFTRTGPGPIMTASLHEPFLVGDSFVQEFENKMCMWYIYGTRWIENDVEEAARVYKIGQAVSEDGINWQRYGHQIIKDRLNEDECQALPTVIFHNGKYHMYFCYRHAIGFRKDKTKGYRLGYAWSTDMENWHRDDENAGITTTDTGWDSDMMCYPHIFHCDNNVYLMYNGNEFGKYGFGLAILEEN